MNRFVAVLCLLILFSLALWAMPLGSSARTVIPSDIQQIISVDYRALKNSETAQALKHQVLPPTLKEFELALKGVVIDAEKDVEQLTFASYRVPKQGVKVVGIAQGQFSTTGVLKKMRLNKIRATKYRDVNTYPMSGGMQMALLNEDTLVFGDLTALKGALDARDGYIPALDSNSQVVDMVGSVDSGACSISRAHRTCCARRSAMLPAWRIMRP